MNSPVTALRLFLLAGVTMLAFAANSVLNRWAVGPGHIGAVEFACLRLVAQLSVPVIAALGGAALLAEVPGPRFWLAAALVLGGVSLASLPYRSLASRSTR